MNDAYALEKQLIEVLEKQTGHAEDYPAIRQRLEAHLAQTRRHAELVEQCVEQLGGKVSTTKSGLGKMAGFWQGLSSGAADDVLVKDCLADFSMENLEIASYKGLISGAEAAGEMEVADVCERILRDEEEMAQWLEEQIPLVVEDYVAQQQAA